VGLIKELMLEPGLRPQVIQECCTLIDAEVADKKGLSGIAIKAGYSVFRAVKKTALAEAVDNLLDDFVEVLDGQHARYLQARRADETLKAYLVAHKQEVAESLLAITDRRQEASTHKTVKGAYGKLRPQAALHVQEALPRVADLLERHLARPRPA